MTNRDNSIKDKLVGRFAYLGDKVNIPRPRRIFADIPAADFRKVFEYVIGELGFRTLASLTGLDEGENLSFLYHMASLDGIVLTLKLSVAKKDPVIDTVTDLFRGADIYERELMDLLGAKVRGLAEGKRYPLPDNWPKDDYPLRKDWKKNA